MLWYYWRDLFVSTPSCQTRSWMNEWIVLTSTIRRYPRHVRTEVTPGSPTKMSQLPGPRVMNSHLEKSHWRKEKKNVLQLLLISMTKNVDPNIRVNIFCTIPRKSLLKSWESSLYLTLRIGQKYAFVLVTDTFLGYSSKINSSQEKSLTLAIEFMIPQGDYRTYLFWESYPPSS